MIGALWVAVAGAHMCDEARMADVDALQGPAILVLGERHGNADDLRSARHIVERLATKGKVRLALEAVHEQNQGVVEAYMRGELKTRELPSAMHWQETWGHAYRPYKKLLKLAKKGVELRGAGLKLGPKPDDREVAIPEGYDARLKAAMAGHAHQMSDEVKGRFTTSMAWRDFRIGELAAQDWSGEGVLVVLTGRGHVEGSQGTNWQLKNLVQVPIHSIVLAHEGAQCLPGDRIWAE